jgi:mercuric ion transport protein
MLSWSAGADHAGFFGRLDWGAYSPIFIGLAMLSLFFAWRRIWRPAADCAPGEVCAVPQARRAYKILFSVVVALILVALVFPYAAPWFY